MKRFTTSISAHSNKEVHWFCGMEVFSFRHSREGGNPFYFVHFLACLSSCHPELAARPGESAEADDFQGAPKSLDTLNALRLGEEARVLCYGPPQARGGVEKKNRGAVPIFFISF